MGVSNPDKEPLERRGIKTGSNNPYSYMKYTNGTESIQVSKGKIELTANEIILNGTVKNNA